MTAAPWQPANPLLSLDAPYPNPFSDDAAVSFKLHGRTLVNLALYDLQGKKVATLINDRWLDYGKHIEKIDSDKLLLTPGVYVAILTADGHVMKQKMLKM